MMRFDKVTDKVSSIRRKDGEMGVEITSIHHDSREVSEGSLFIALKGLTVDGHKYISQAIKQGASAIVYDNPDLDAPEISSIRVTDSRKALAEIAANFYEHPEARLRLIGITGTNGKTTTNYFLEHLLNAADLNTGRIGTTGANYKSYSADLIHTTPESSDLYALLRDFADEGAQAATLEISSHALAQSRVVGLDFSLALFTNLSQDHLDYHNSFEEYIASKRLLFSGLSSEALGLINADDPYSTQMVSSSPAKILNYGLSEDSDYWVKAYSVDDSGTHIELKTPSQDLHIQANTVGRFNIYNLVGAFAAALELGADPEALIDTAKTLPTVPGRLELMHNQAPFKVFVDYAHTPDAMSTVLTTLSEAYPDSKLISVFGCGGDRDKGKRPIMGEIATRISTFAIVTDDNPRTEKPMDIIDTIVEGCEGRMNYIVIQNRTEAVQTALNRAEPGDIIAILGKGHEAYQEIMGKRIPYSDMTVINQFMEQYGYSA